MAASQSCVLCCPFPLSSLPPSLVRFFCPVWRKKAISKNPTILSLLLWGGSSRTNARGDAFFPGLGQSELATKHVALQLLEGAALSSLHLSLYYSPPLPFFCPFCSPCISGMGYMHSFGIIHRDMKLENVILGPQKGRRQAAKKKSTPESWRRREIAYSRTLRSGSSSAPMPTREWRRKACRSPQRSTTTLGKKQFQTAFLDLCS